MNYVTGDRKPFIVDSSKIRTTPKKDEKLIKELEFIKKNSVYDKKTGEVYLPPIKIVKD